MARVETKINRHSFYTWFKPTSLVSETSTVLTVRVPNPVFKDWLTKHYSGVIAEALTEIRAGSLSVVFVADLQGEAANIALSSEEAAALETPPHPSSGPAGLNPRYTFDSFIVGSSNQFAHAAS